MRPTLHALIVEDSEDDALLIARELRRGGYELTSERVDTLDDFRSATARQAWQVIIADYSMPHFSALAALRQVWEMGLDVPFIIVSGTIGEDSAVAAMKAGAHDYVMKDNLARLVPAVQRELREAESRQARRRAEERLRESEARYRQSVENSPNPIFTVDRQGRIQMWNRACGQVFQYQAEKIIGEAYHQLLWDSQERTVLDGLLTQVWLGLSVSEQEMQYRCRDGTQRFMVTRIYPVCDLEGRVEGCVFANTDITKRKRAERLLQALNMASLAMQRAATPQEVLTTAGEEFKKLGFSCTIFFTDENQSRLFPKYFSYDQKAVRLAERLIGVKAESFSLSVETAGGLTEAIREGETVFLDGTRELRQVLSKPLRKFAGQILKILEIPKSVVAPLILEDKTVGLLSVQSDDLTEDDMPAITAFAHQMAAAWRKARLMHDLETSLEELKHTQAQLLQAQKMEAIGRLAGGVAHDFNNMLTIVHLCTRLLKRQLHSEDPLLEYVQQIEEAGERATALTKQLLSFSRRDVIEPHVVDLNQEIGNLSRMLQRVIGEDIEFVTVLADDLWPVYLDPVQIDQAIVNLAVNARDAMPSGGCLTIETANVVLDGESAARHVDAQPGDYVRLTVRDTGVGMGDEVKAHLFEPFFTTKERDHGTGLGLSTVFGIIKQNAGHIWVDSEVGQGTAVQIYLPRTEKVEPQDLLRVTPISALHGDETILVVEDYGGVRDLAAQILEAHGYQVLAAKNGSEALRISLRHNQPIHLLLTDMVMPGMNGKELAEQIQAQRPGIRILYMSGYDNRLFEDPAALGEGVAFLAKPLTVETLTEKVRAVLDLPRPG
ncbi:MAG: response regulator [Anaerolineae bacterium]|nr:response regulator [Anaerolineae bacterium]